MNNFQYAGLVAVITIWGLAIQHNINTIQEQIQCGIEDMEKDNE